jgi:hypothetical protein
MGPDQLKLVKEKIRLPENSCTKNMISYKPTYTKAYSLKPTETKLTIRVHIEHIWFVEIVVWKDLIRQDLRATAIWSLNLPGKQIIGRKRDIENTHLAEFPKRKNLIGRKPDVKNIWLVEYSAWNNLTGWKRDIKKIWLI